MPERRSALIERRYNIRRNDSTLRERPRSRDQRSTMCRENRNLNFAFTFIDDKSRPRFHCCFMFTVFKWKNRAALWEIHLHYWRNVSTRHCCLRAFRGQHFPEYQTLGIAIVFGVAALVLIVATGRDLGYQRYQCEMGQ